jgi:C1A family cysteine protease
MRRLLVIGGVLLTLPCAFAPFDAFAQGAIIETLDEVHRLPQPPAFRNRAAEEVTPPAPLPDHVDLSSKMPGVRNQGPTDSCVSWAATYAAASYALRARGVGGAALTLSPSFTYNQAARDQWCRRGTNISMTLNLLRDTGSVPMDEFVFDGGWCGRQPTAAELERARAYRIRSWSAFDATSLDKVKQQLARGVPVIFGVHATAKMQALRGAAVLEEDDAAEEGHAMVAVGYDDGKRAFLVQNSWGTAWGDKGLGWFGYEYWKRNIRVGFVIE